MHAYYAWPATAGGAIAPRPLAHAMHATRPNEMLHFDFLYIGPSRRGFQCVLILKDDLSSYPWLEPCELADAATAAYTLMQWLARLGVCATWISDQGSHFKSQLIATLRDHYDATHHFTHPRPTAQWRSSVARLFAPFVL